MPGTDEPAQTRGSTPTAEESTRLQHEAAESQLPDPILRVLVSVCNRGSLTFGVTVAQGGLVISGIAVGVARFMHNMAADLEARGGVDAEVLSEPLRYLALIAEDPAPDPVDQSDPVDDLPLYLHLEDARVRGGGALLADGVQWRGRLADVNGWSLGLHE